MEPMAELLFVCRWLWTVPLPLLRETDEIVIINQPRDPVGLFFKK